MTGADSIAIVGLGCRFPGAADLDAFWHLLTGARDATEDTPPSRWDVDAVFHPDPAVPGTTISKRGGFLEHVDRFDADFFGISPREAPFVDPRQRLMLEITWEALERAGIRPSSLAGSRTGVYVATLTNDYEFLLFRDLTIVSAFSGSGTADSVVANRLSYFFDLRGPSVSLDTACSGSLIAVHLACQSLRSGETDLALAGGVSINLLPKSNVLFTKMGALSPNGRCATFDKDADGIVRSEGAGVAVLKRLADAMRDGDPILAVVAGSATNHGGRSTGIMAPSAEGQAEVLAEAYRRAGVDPGAVQYVETHGTGTKLGDPIEVRALAAVVGNAPTRRTPCVLGALKSNIGHAEPAAGIAGIIKATLAIANRAVPANIHFTSANPLTGLDELPFRVPTTLEPWPDPEAPLVAGISGFGFAGSNAHVVLTEPPKTPTRDHPPPGHPFVLPISARSADAARALSGAYREYLLDHPELVGDVCHTTAVHRDHHLYRVAVVGDSATALADALQTRKPPLLSPHRSIAFVYAGQGSHWPAMGRDLFAREPAFRTAIEECAATMDSLTGWSLIDAITNPDAALDRTDVAQPAIFAMQVALTALWRAWGVEPSVIAGHSLGEIAAAHAAGVLTLPQASRIVVLRSRYMARAAGRGRTAVVGLDLAAAARALADTGDVVIAGNNSPSSTVIAGDAAKVEEVVANLAAQGTFARVIQGVDIAFHSPHMDAPSAALVAALEGLQPAAPRVPIVSSVTASLVRPDEMGAEYWGRNLREPFRFAETTSALIEHGATAIIEISPSSVLASALVQTTRALRTEVTVTACMRREEPALNTLAASLALAYEHGAAVRWEAYSRSGRALSNLPAYPWQRQRYWLDQQEENTDVTRKRGGAHPLLGERVDAAPIGNDDAFHSLWELDIEPRRPRYVTDHRVRGQVVLPGAAILESALAIAASLFPGRDCVVSNVRFLSPVTIPENHHQRVQFNAAITRDGASCAMHTRTSNRSWQKHASWQIEVVDGAASADLEDGASIQKRLPTRIDVTQHYARLRANGLDYGPAFQNIREGWCSDREAWATLEIRDLRADAYLAHPALLDAAFQSVAAAVFADPGQQDREYLPAAVGRWCVRRPIGRRAMCHVTLREKRANAITADIDLRSETGEWLARCEGFELRAAASTHGALQAALHDVQWEHRPLEPTSVRAERWLVFADRAGFADLVIRDLRDAGCEVITARAARDYRQLTPHAFEIRPESPQDINALLGEIGVPDGALHAWALDADTVETGCTHACASLLHLAQSGLMHRPFALRVLTHLAQPLDNAINVAQGGVAGLAMAISQEAPDFRCRHIDIGAMDEDNAHTVAQELFADDGETTVAWRRGERYVSRIRTITSARASQSVIRKDATYVITGGLGALGITTAAALARAGAGHIVLVSRRGDAGAPPELDQLREQGARITVVAADVSKEEDISALFSGALSGLPPLRGVIHAAGVLADAMLPHQSANRFLTVARPKALGAWWLHQYTRALELDFFALFSSAASFIGSPGQANYAAANSMLDALAHARHAMGLPATSINWGAWADDGMAADPHVRARMNARGVQLIPVEAGTALLMDLLGPDAPPQVGVIPIDWPRFLTQFTGAVPALFARVAGTAVVAASPRQALEAAPAAERQTHVTQYLRQQLAAVLGFPDDRIILPTERFFDLGMDSLTAVELRNRVQVGLGIELPVTLAFDFPSLGALATLVHERVFPAAADDLDQLSDIELTELLARELDDVDVK